MNNIQTIGNMGCYQGENMVLAFTMGEQPNAGNIFPGLNEYGQALLYSDMLWSTIAGPNGQMYNVLWRGEANRKCEEIEQDIKQNKTLPRLIKKQTAMLYGQGIMLYMPTLGPDGKYTRQWVTNKEVTNWLESWEANGIETNYKEVAKTFIKNFYTFGDFFSKFRFSRGKSIGVGLPVTGLEAPENKYCRLATMRQDVAYSMVEYKDFRFVALGKWGYSLNNFSFFPLFRMSEVDNYNYAAISHHRDKSVGEIYGLNETHAGTQPYIKGANLIPKYINSFLKNSLAAKKHVKIPYAWIESKRNQMMSICKENIERQKNNDSLITFYGLEVGTKFKESVLMEYISLEMKNLTNYLSGAENQGKAFISISFLDKGVLQEWVIEDVDMKYKEYIESLIAVDKRADDVLITSLGMDASISAISKDGVISKSGADVYYNYLIYLMQLNPEDEICSEPFNIALQLNFPALYKQGYRLGFYRETPSRQEDVAPANRLNQQQS